MAWLRTIDTEEATGALAAIFQKMRERRMPPVYVPPHGGAPGIIRAHSLDAKLIEIVFAGMSVSLATEDTLPWPRRELVNTVTSLVNQCFY